MGLVGILFRYLTFAWKKCGAWRDSVIRSALSANFSAGKDVRRTVLSSFQVFSGGGDDELAMFDSAQAEDLIGDFP